MAGVVRMGKNNQNHEEYPICFLSDFFGAGKDIKDTLTKDIDKYILSTGGIISLSKLANKLCDPEVQGKTNRTWTINDYRVFESVLVGIGYKICKEYDKKGRLKVAYITR
jgi:hypothetical protein